MKRILTGLAIGLCYMASAQNAFTEDSSITFTNADASITFGATLTMPKGKQDFATVVIVSGTGPQNRDGEMAGHNQFKVLADYLSSHGIAVLRTDDRGVGKTTGIYDSATTGDFANDALTAIRYLRSRNDIDTAKIGLLGHSEGGAAISLAAAKSSEVKFLVSIAGLAMNGFDAQIDQNKNITNSAPIPWYDKKRRNEIDSLMFMTALAYTDSSNLEDKLNETYYTWHPKDSVYFASLHVKFDHFRFPIYGYTTLAKSKWYRYFIKYDAAAIMSKIKVPVLAINGNKDLMVSYRPNLENWKKYPAEGGNTDVTTVVLPNVNHLLLPCTQCTIEEYSTIKKGFSPLALQTIAGWINKKFN